MALYFKDIEITKIRDLAPQTWLDITDLWFGGTNVYTVWQVYEGTLPATLNANGSDVRQYQVWGNTGGVGDKTVNLFDESKAGMIQFRPATAIARYGINFGILPAGAYTIRFNRIGSQSLILTFLYSDNYSDVNLTNNSPYTFTAPENAEIIIRTQSDIPTTFSNMGFTNIMLTEGSTAPASYVPYGYGLDISTSDGTNTTTTPIYIGNEPLDKDEYVDYQAGKVFRRTVNLFDKDVALDGYEIVNNGINYNANWCVSAFIPVEGNTLYKSVNSGGAALSYTDKSSQPTRLVGSLHTGGVRTLSETKFIKMNCQISQKASCIVAKSGDLPETYIPYLQPTDPPVALPALPTVDGTTIVDYAGESVAPEKALLKYRKKNF